MYQYVKMLPKQVNTIYTENQSFLLLFLNVAFNASMVT